MRIFHISDAHFGNEQPAFAWHALKNAFYEYREVFSQDDTYFVVSGDVTLKGNINGYKQAQKFFNEVWLDNGGARDRFIACPGNHDICEKKFDAFDAFISEMRRDNLLSFEKSSANFVDLKNATFLSINSADHRDAGYGFIDLAEMQRKLEIERPARSLKKQRIALVHHNIFGIHKADSSAIRNSLALVALLDEHQFDVILHGHQHAQTVVTLGSNQIKLFAGRSLNFSSPGLINGFSELIYENDEWTRLSRVLSSDNSATQQLKFKSLEA
jgi:3',5'-cyclic AMP phosphodiesterase CpdA